MGGLCFTVLQPAELAYQVENTIGNKWAWGKGGSTKSVTLPLCLKIVYIQELSYGLFLDIFVNLFIQQIFLSIRYVPDALLGTGFSVVNTMNLLGVLFSRGGQRRNQNIK